MALLINIMGMSRESRRFEEQQQWRFAFRSNQEPEHLVDGTRGNYSTVALKTTYDDSRLLIGAFKSGLRHSSKAAESRVPFGF